MPASDFFAVLRWALVLVGLGILTFPISSRWFSRFGDQGWAFAKILGLGFLSYWIFLAGSLNLAAFDSFAVWVGLTLVGSASYVLWKSDAGRLRVFLRRRWRWIVFEEALFFLGLLFWSWVRGHQPEINGLEKFMDFGFVNSILKSSRFPPADLWLSGMSINYYYFGHLTTAVMTKLSGLAPSVAYNLMIATLFALTLSCGFSLGSGVFRGLLRGIPIRQQRRLSVLSGFISALVLVFAGNLHTIVSLMTKGADTYWYPDATRYIPYTIHEFPHYSFVVADLHGHVNNIPYVLLTLATVLNLLFTQGRSFSLQFSSRLLLRLAGLGWLVGILYMTNALDAPIYLLVIGVLLLTAAHQRPFLGNLWKAARAFLVITVAGLVLTLPFHLAFRPFTAGVGLVEARSDLTSLLVLWGFFLLIGGVFVFLSLLGRLRGSLPRLDRRMSRSLMVLMAVSLLLVLVPEVIYFKDIYIREYHRANTMFKLVYQSFLMMSLLSGPVLGAAGVFFLKARGGARFVLLFALAVCLAGFVSVLTYPYFSVRGFYNRLQNYQGLDGLAWLERRYPDDSVAIRWLQSTVVGQPVIAEAVGESYTDYARVSTNTGLPTILGWRVHEWLWRGSFDEPARRTEDVARLYTTASITEACAIIERYGVSYIFVGTLERQQYRQLTESTFRRIGDAVYALGNTRIYRVRLPCGGLPSSTTFSDYLPKRNDSTYRCTSSQELSLPINTHCPSYSVVGGWMRNPSSPASS